jgi:hypothetical protein
MDVLSFYLVLLFQDRSKLKELGPAMWTVFKELEAVFNVIGKSAKFHRLCLNDPVPGLKEPGTGPHLNQARQAIKSAQWWNYARGKFSRTFDHVKILGQVGRLIRPHWGDGVLLVFTDVEIMPPDGWRYIIWDMSDEDLGKGTLVSLAPIDPLYWRIAERNRLSIIKHRMRSAGCSAIGSWLGLNRCDNTRCFMYEPVDSVLRLDDMVYFGEEHPFPELLNKGFSPNILDPAIQQPVQDMSKHESLNESR